jgi:hypothetical protein
MNTEGPAISFFTSCWLLPQNEQYSSFSPLEDFLSDMEKTLESGFYDLTREFKHRHGYAQ